MINGRPDPAHDDPFQREINIKSQGDTLIVGKVFKDLQAKYRIEEKKIDEMNLVAGELSENILRHSGRGRLVVSYRAGKVPTVEVMSENEGVLPADAQSDGVTTKAGLGIGLGIVSRLSDAVTYEQDGEILRIQAIKYCDDFPDRSEVAVLSFPVSLHDKSNGDSFFIHKNRDDLFCVIDALGHGEEAYASACVVQGLLKANPGREIDDMILAAHELLKERHLRGAAVSIVRTDYASETLRFCGLGDVMGKIFSPDGNQSQYLLPQEGIVGDLCRTMQVQRFPLVRGSIIALYSDGLSNKLNIPQELRGKKPTQLVNDLMKQYGKLHDDRTLLLAKIL
jgi:anti-sigma regulatory factor (Ser/Thr protein kinase)